jgi:ubiquinone/menaquinone biosynthesis C-methylase UbiE/alpha-beta hydrolase superfamily lysophospholipase
MIKTERRRYPRLEHPIDARLTINGAVWVGRGTNLSNRGTYILFPGAPPVTEGQSIHLGIETPAAGVLQVSGTVRWFREEPAGSDNSPEDEVGLAVEFEPLPALEKTILASILEELHTELLPIKITAALISEDTGDLLLEVGSVGTEPLSISEHETGEVELRERRLLPRVNLGLPLYLGDWDKPLLILERETVSLNLSADGVCFLFKGGPIHPGEKLVIRLLPLEADPPPTHQNECMLVCEVIWVAPDTTVPSAFRVGTHIVHQSAESQRRMAQIIGQLLALEEVSEEADTAGAVTSVMVEFRNDANHRIIGYHDSPRDQLAGSPLVIIAPGYGETKREHIELASYLACNGLHVLRYDHTNHTGESEGDILSCTLTSMKHDLTAAVDFATRAWPGSPIGIIATSLVGRVALKLAAEDKRFNFLALVNGIVDLQATLLAVHQEDLILTFLQGSKRGVTNVLGYNVDLDRFLEDAVEGGYSDLQSTIHDAKKVEAALVLFTAENDSWVLLKSVEEVHQSFRSGSAQLFRIPEALHRLQENPRKARAVFRHLVTCCQAQLCPEVPQIRTLDPSQRQMGMQNRLERDRARGEHQIAKADNVEFWRDYLDHFHYIVNFKDYWQLLDHIYRLMGKLEGGEQILDAGCGNGNFGMFMLINHAYRCRSVKGTVPRPLRYVGLDFVQDALATTRRNLIQVTTETDEQLPPGIKPHSLMAYTLACADLNVQLPFVDNQFDRIVCNLVIGYLTDPSQLLNEFMRVLAPGGKLVLTNLKPHADLSQIYRNFVQKTEAPQEVEEARQLLNNAGKIKQGESQGIFRFFDRQELLMVLISTGGVNPRIYSTFANQAYIAVIEKPDIASEMESQKPAEALTLSL